VSTVATARALGFLGVKERFALTVAQKCRVGLADLVY
jgi:hypothetical protein